jgi:hypothetical protein
MDKEQSKQEAPVAKGAVAAGRDSVDSNFKGIDVGGSAFTREDRT